MSLAVGDTLYCLVLSIYHIRSWLLLSDEGYGNISGVSGHVYIVTFFLGGGCKVDSLAKVALIRIL